MKILGIGDNVADRYVRQQLMYPGGQAMNFAAVGRMLGAHAAFLGVFGNDEISDHNMSVLDELGVDRSRCRRYVGDNGFAFVDQHEGDRIFLGSNKGGALREHPLELGEDDIDYCKAFDWIHTSNNSYLDNKLPKLKMTGIPLSYDFSTSWRTRGDFEEICCGLELAFLSGDGDSAEALDGVADMMLSFGCKSAIITMGAGGALFRARGLSLHEPAHKTEVLDTMGAGDAFLAGFVTCCPETGNSEKRFIVEARMRAGAQAAAKTCRNFGAFGYGKDDPGGIAALEKNRKVSHLWDT